MKGHNLPRLLHIFSVPLGGAEEGTGGHGIGWHPVGILLSAHSNDMLIVFVLFHQCSI